MRTLAIGDIHGCLAAFNALLEQVCPDRDDLLITLGDYIDRGPESRGVLDRLLALRDTCRLVTLKGNHDLMMVAARESQDSFADWLKSGGRQTLESYGAAEDRQKFATSVPPPHWKLLQGECVPYHEIETHFFVHANVDPLLPLSDQPETMLYWEKLEAGEWRPHDSGKVMVCGHSQQRSGRPLVLDRAVCIDTWAHGDGWLTCLDVDMELYWQANQHGQTRVGNLSFRKR